MIPRCLRHDVLADAFDIARLLLICLHFNNSDLAVWNLYPEIARDLLYTSTAFSKSSSCEQFNLILSPTPLKMDLKTLGSWQVGPR